MDTPVTPPVNEDLIEYKRLYSEYMSMVVELHNYHVRFLELRPGTNKHGIQLRRHIRRMAVLAGKIGSKTLDVLETQRILVPGPVYKAPKRTEKNTKPPNHTGVKRKNADL